MASEYDENVVAILQRLEKWKICSPRIPKDFKEKSSIPRSRSRDSLFFDTTEGTK